MGLLFVIIICIRQENLYIAVMLILGMNPYTTKLKQASVGAETVLGSRLFHKLMAKGPKEYLELLVRQKGSQSVMECDA